MYVCMHACMYVCMYVFMYVCIQCSAFPTLNSFPGAYSQSQETAGSSSGVRSLTCSCCCGCPKP